jgi:hypothetical protein
MHFKRNINHRTKHTTIQRAQVARRAVASRRSRSGFAAAVRKAI